MTVGHNGCMAKKRTSFYGEILCDECGEPCTTKPNYRDVTKPNYLTDPQPIPHECKPEDIMQEAIRKIVARGISGRWTADQIATEIVETGYCAPTNADPVPCK